MTATNEGLTLSPYVSLHSALRHRISYEEFLAEAVWQVLGPGGRASRAAIAKDLCLKRSVACDGIRAAINLGWAEDRAGMICRSDRPKRSRARSFCLKENEAL